MPLPSQLIAAVLGGLVVAATFLVLGVTGRRTTRLVIEQAPMSDRSESRLTPHAIYVRDAPGVVVVTADSSAVATDAFGPAPSTTAGESTGSGFLISAGGYILTVAHIVRGADPRHGVTVAFEHDAARRAVVVGSDASDDLALLKVDMTGLGTVRPLPLGDSATVRVGDPTLAIGDPFGGDRTLASGIVSALQPQLRAVNGLAIANVIQTDRALDPRTSGGPLLDAAGRVIGINSQISTAVTGIPRPIRVGFAVPIDTVRAFIPEVQERAATQSRSGAPGTSPTMSVWKRARRRSSSAG